MGLVCSESVRNCDELCTVAGEDKSFYFSCYNKVTYLLLLELKRLIKSVYTMGRNGDV